MKLILLSGGSGKRLWPLSNESRSKQFLKVLNGPNGMESMVQRVWRQLQSTGLADDAVIATSQSQSEILLSQLEENIPLIIEPSRRDTFPAILLAASYLYTVMTVPLDETIVVLPVDPFVEESFFYKIKDLETALEVSEADLALLGVRPDFPSEKYGYIVPHPQINQEGEYLTVSHFREKPNERDAKRLMQQKALWNCGIFGFKLSYVINLLKESNYPISYEQLSKRYFEMPKISFDYKVVENANHIIALTYNGKWKDLGTWNTLMEEMGSSVVGNGILDDSVSNSHIINELDIPVVLMGVSNAIIAASPDGILISDKSVTPKVKEFIHDLDGRPMYEERRWGWHRILDVTKYPDGKQVLIKRVCIERNKNLSYHLHKKRDETWTILQGSGKLVINGQMKYIGPGDTIQISAGTEHAVQAVETLEFMEVQSGNELTSDDIMRIHMDWSDIIRLIT